MPLGSPISPRPAPNSPGAVRRSPRAVKKSARALESEATLIEEEKATALPQAKVRIFVSSAYVSVTTSVTTRTVFTNLKRKNLQVL